MFGNISLMLKRVQHDKDTKKPARQLCFAGLIVNLQGYLNLAG
jgi:hypothetical protein